MERLHELNTLLINTVMQDVFNPPVSSRIYAYPNIICYEIMTQDNNNYPSLYGKLTDFPKLPAMEESIQNDYNPIVALLCFSKVAQKLVGSEIKFEDWEKGFVDSLKRSHEALIIDKCVLAANNYSKTFNQWVRADNYNETRAMPRFQNDTTVGSWELTPLDYQAALEPHWNKMRTLAIDSAQQILPKKNLVYSEEKSSLFQKNVRELYQISKQLDTSKKAIAKYWDDNPNVSVNIGHLNYFVHKISPAGHWMMIAKQACEKEKTSFAKTAQVYAITSIAMFDAFISCWEVKFATDLIRPITVINRGLDKNWEPYLQTPPFPEFTSGHAVVSNSAAAVLTRLLGKNFSFVDKTEIPFGNQAKSFKSFYAASKEVSWSRVYGGIHYPYTAKVSILQGKNIGKNAIDKLTRR